jgi:hypothetical protein
MTLMFAAVDVFTAGNNFIAAAIGLMVGLAVLLGLRLVLATLHSSQGAPMPVFTAILIAAAVIFFVRNPDPIVNLVAWTLRTIGID